MQTPPNGIKRRHLRAFVGLVVPSVLATAAATGLWRVLVDVLATVRRGAPTTPATVLLGTLALLGLGGLAWLLLGVVLEALSGLPGAVGRAARAASAALSPRVVRRAAAFVVGVGVGAGVPTSGAQAEPRPLVAAVRTVGQAVLAPAADGASATAASPDPSWQLGPDPGWTPEPPRVRPQPDLTVLAGHARTDDDPTEVVVRRGDSLWSIAARHLPEDAGDAEIAAAWPLWYDANRDVVGADPDLIRPGQVLRVPRSAAEPAAEVGS